MHYDIILALQSTKKCVSNELKAFKLRKQTITCPDFDTWCKNHFNMSTIPGNLTVLRIVRASINESAVRIARISKGLPNGERINPVLETALFSSIGDRASPLRMINGPIVQTKATCLLEMCNEPPPGNKQISMQFNDE